MGHKWTSGNISKKKKPKKQKQQQKQTKKKNPEGYFQNFSWFLFYVDKLCMIMCTCIAP